MKTLPAILAALILSPLSFAADAPKPAAQSLATRAVSARGSDFDRLPVVLGLTGPAMEKYQKLLAQRNEGYDKWAKSPRGVEYAAASKELDAARKGQDADKLAKAKAKYEPLRAEQRAVRNELRRQFNTQFDLGQLKVWAAMQLQDQVAKQLTSVKLTDEQKQQAFVVCLVLTSHYVTEGEALRDPYLDPADWLTSQAVAIIKQAVLPTPPQTSQTGTRI